MVRGNTHKHTVSRAALVKYTTFTGRVRACVVDLLTPRLCKSFRPSNAVTWTVGFLWGWSTQLAIEHGMVALVMWQSCKSHMAVTCKSCTSSLLLLCGPWQQALCHNSYAVFPGDKLRCSRQHIISAAPWASLIFPHYLLSKECEHWDFQIQTLTGGHNCFRRSNYLSRANQ